MVHTFELSKELSKETFEQIVNQYSWRWYKSTFSTTAFADKGLPMVRLRKETDKTNKNYKHYMSYISVNTGTMFNGDPHFASYITEFSLDFIGEIYQRICDAIPCLEKYPEIRMEMQREAKLIAGLDIHYEKWKRLKNIWMAHNSFKASRIDYTFDLAYHPDEYLELLNSGFPIKRRVYCRTNIYNKQKALRDKGLPFDPNVNYNFLRIEVQANKGKLDSLLTKMKNGKIPVYAESQCRELQYLTSPEIEKDVLTFYLKQITGTGEYVPYSVAIDTINGSNYSEVKKDRLKEAIVEIGNCNGIANLLELVENGTISDLGKVKTVRQYLRDIQALGINPVTVHSGMNVPAFAAIPVGKDVTDAETASIEIHMFPNLLHFVESYCKETREQRRDDITLTTIP